MLTGQPHAAVWLDIPQRCQLRGKFTGDWDIHVMFGDPNDEVNLIIERSTLARFVDVASELLAVPAPKSPEADPPETTSRR